ncbi:MAG: PAS domain S-box protein, partial [Dehalococcoidia bacterium]|nr:PAS domain S-box protein [Dehalococcoidia bacterium]
MKDADKTKVEPIDELGLLRQRITELEAQETKHKQAEEMLKQSEERYRTILDEMEDAYHEVDLAGNYTFCSDSMCRMLGYSRQEVLGMSFRVVMPKEDAEAVYREYNQVYRTGKPVRGLPTKVVRKDGTTGFTELSAFPMQNQDG